MGAMRFHQNWQSSPRQRISQNTPKSTEEHNVRDEAPDAQARQPQGFPGNVGGNLEMMPGWIKALIASKEL